MNFIEHDYEGNTFFSPATEDSVTAEKTYTILRHRKGRVMEATGTLEYLTGYFRYKLESGRSYDSRIPLKPRTVKALVNALNRATDHLQRGSFNPNFYELKEAE